MDNFRGVGQGDRKVPDETPELRMKRFLKLGVVAMAACLGAGPDGFATRASDDGRSGSHHRRTFL
jgi:hypothetical protein